MRSPTGLKIAIVAASLLLMGAAASATTMVDNPPYKSWSNFKVGSYSVVRKKIQDEANAPQIVDATAEPPGGKVLEITLKLIKLTPKEAVVEESAKEIGSDSITELPPRRIIYPAKIAAENAAPTAKNQMTSFTEGDQNLHVAGNQIKTHWVDSTINIGGEISSEKLWMSDEIPGGTVKEVLTKSENGKPLMSSETTVLGFKGAR